MAQGRRGAAPSASRSEAYRNRVSQQQAVLNQLRAGKPIVGAQAATPFLNIFGSTGGLSQPKIPPLYAAELGGQEILINRGGWGQGAEKQGAINVGGRTWDPAERNGDLVYLPRGEAGQYGSVFPSDQTAPVEPGKTPPGAQPPAASPVAKLSPEELAYNQERSRIAQLTAQNPEFQNIDQLRNNLRDQGMAIWAAKYGGPGGLASKVKPGQSGYDVIQGTLAGQAAAQGYGYQMPQQIIPTPPPGVNAPQGLPAVQSFGATETYGPQGLQVDPEMAKKFQLLLNQANK